MDLLNNPYFEAIGRREKELVEHWATRFGSMPARNVKPADWPEGYRSPCADCAARFTHQHIDENIGLDGIEPASTFYNAYEARYLVCERHWRARMYGAGYTKAEVRTILIEQGGFSAEEADAAMAEDPETEREEYDDR